MPQVVEIPNLSRDEARERAANFSIDAVQVDTIPQADGRFTVRATYPDGVVVPGATPSGSTGPVAPAGGQPGPASDSQPDAGTGPTITPDSTGAFSIKGLTKAAADAEAAFFRDSGSSVDVVADGATFTVRVKPPAPPPPPPPAPPAPPSPPSPPPPSPPQPAPPAATSAAPDLDGYVICLDRIRTERRSGMAFDRTVSRYQAYFNRVAIPEISGMAVERQGPGDNGPTGVSQHRRLEAKTYPLFTHAGDNIKYRTLGYLSPPNFPNRPWPCLGIENTGSREGVLIHCASGYLMSIGCINLTSNVANAQTNLDFNDSWRRVKALIDSIRTRLGAAFPNSNNQRLPNTFLVIRE